MTVVVDHVTRGMLLGEVVPAQKRRGYLSSQSAGSTQLLRIMEALVIRLLRPGTRRNAAACRGANRAKVGPQN